MANTYLKFRIALTIVSAIGLILYIVAFALPKWSQHNSETNGIWHICFTNAGAESCSVWPDNLKTTSLQVVQVFSCLGLISYILFIVSGAMTIFWTNRWKAARAIKFSAAVLAVLSAIFVTVAVAIYKTDKGSDPFSISYSWYFAIIGAVVAGIVAPFYFVDAYRTVAPKKLDREQFFKNINIPPKPTFGKFESQEDKLQLGNGGRPPLLNELRRHRTSFVHPPPKPRNKILTSKEIKSFPIPPSKTKLDLFEKTEIENHPAPQQQLLITTVADDVLEIPDEKSVSRNEDVVSSQIISPESDHDTEKIDIKEHSVFKFHKTKTIQKGGKTMLKIQNENAKLPPVMMIMPGTDENCDDNVDDSISRRTMKYPGSEWELEQARLKFAPYFEDIVKKNDDENEQEIDTTKKKFKSLIKKNKKDSKAIKGRMNDVSGIYSGEPIEKEKPKEKRKKKFKKKEKLSRPFSNTSSFSRKSDIETCVTTYSKDDSFHTQNGLTIHNELEDLEI